MHATLAQFQDNNSHQLLNSHSACQSNLLGCAVAQVQLVLVSRRFGTSLAFVHHHSLSFVLSVRRMHCTQLPKDNKANTCACKRGASVGVRDPICCLHYHFILTLSLSLSFSPPPSSPLLDCIEC